MTPAQTNIACAERLGWIIEIYSATARITGYGRLKSEPYGTIREIPNFHGSADACFAHIAPFAFGQGWLLAVNGSIKKCGGAGPYEGSFTPFRGEHTKVVAEFGETASAAICAAFLKLPHETK